MYTNPQVTDFQSYYARDFPYGATNAYVMNSDITTALTDAETFINPNLFCNQGQYTQGVLWLAAHFLVMNLRASSQGISGQYPWLNSGKAVGSISESFVIPERIMANPELAALSKTYYGMKFLTFVIPLLSGQIFTTCSQPNP